MTIKRRHNLKIVMLLLLLLISLSNILSAQKNDSIIVQPSRFGGAVTVSTKGISTIPNLTLGMPSIVFDMVMGRRLTFEPQFRFSLEGKPWAIVFWWRYAILTGNKFTLNVSANPSMAFKSVPGEVSGESHEIIRTTRYVAAALSPNFQVNKYLGVGMYLFYTKGIEKYITQNTYMVSLRPGISNILITQNITARVGPEMYYLKMDDREGIFLNTTFLISKRNFPLSITGLINKPLRSNIPADYDFLWNLSLVYTFNKEFRQMHS
jgi:hypothetical protein